MEAWSPFLLSDPNLNCSPRRQHNSLSRLMYQRCHRYYFERNIMKKWHRNFKLHGLGRNIFLQRIPSNDKYTRYTSFLFVKYTVYLYLKIKGMASFLKKGCGWYKHIPTSATKSHVSHKHKTKPAYETKSRHILSSITNILGTKS